MAKTLLFDIEVSRDVVEGYGNKWEFKVVKTVRHQELMCFAYKWLGGKKVHYVSRNDFKKYHDFVDALRALLDEADIVIAHNANGFDVKMANRYFLEQGIAPPSPYKTVDTLRVARSTFKFQSNSLNELSAFLGLGAKEKITYADIETEFMNNPTPRVERLMRKYNVQDVILLERLYLKMLPFIRNHPNVGDINQMDGVCPKCGSNDLEKRGFNKSRAGKKQRYQCNNCFGWCNEANIRKVGRTTNAQ